ncbi:putative membrane protein [Serinicoccus hydrothermalis]|uniref:Putative membrane protein n=1 Tax=Serinicoccus hydrothermalis TaxID=1758689 RepID=A0A1B1NB92_9MICO|nr:acyltransferase [Serinicoccus hydrothermalis]ANS78709.1 putative membrane protein [Serinicoccus hydrothermalis]
MPAAQLPHSPSRPRLAALDGLRLVAAVAVLAYHYTSIDQEFWGNAAGEEFPTPSIFTRYGYLGVELFFVISGFVILMTAYGRGLPGFVASRLSRLYPAYWAAVVLTVLLQAFWDGGRQVEPVEALVNLTMMQEAWDITSVQGAFWTLWVELKFYLLIGVLLALGGITRRRAIALAMLWPVLAELARATDADLLASLLIPSWAPYFAGGMLLYLLHREGPDLLVGLGLGLNVVLCIRQATIFAEERALVHSEVAISTPVVTVLVLVMFAAVYACSSGPLARLEWRWLTLAGALTYPLYLVHGQFGFFVIESLSGTMSSYLVLVLAAAVSFLLAWLIHRFVERPVHEPLRRRLRDALERD